MYVYIYSIYVQFKEYELLYFYGWVSKQINFYSEYYIMTILTKELLGVTTLCKARGVRHAFILNPVASWQLVISPFCAV